MVWALELILAAAVLSISIAFFLRRPSAEMAVAIILIAVFFHVRVVWNDTGEFQKTTFVGNLAVEISEKFFGHYPLDSRDAQARWESSFPGEAVFRDDGIHIYVADNCLRGPSISREIGFERGISIRACSLESGGDGTSFLVRHAGKSSGPIFLPSNSCETFVLPASPEKSNISIIPLFEGKPHDEIVIKHVQDAYGKGTPVLWDGPDENNLLAFLSSSYLGECKSPCRRIAEGGEIILDYCKCSEPSEILLDLGSKGKFVNIRACAGEALSGSASFFSFFSDEEGRTENTLLPLDCRTFSQPIGKGALVLSKAVPGGALCSDETVRIKAISISDAPDNPPEGFFG